MKVALHKGDIVEVETLIEDKTVHCSFIYGEVKFLFKVVEYQELELHESMTIQNVDVPLEDVPSSILALMFDVEEFIDDVRFNANLQRENDNSENDFQKGQSIKEFWRTRQ